MSKYRQARRLYLLHEKKQTVHQIYKHIYPGGLPWEHSTTYPKQSLKRKINLYLSSVPIRLKCVKLRFVQKLRMKRLHLLKALNQIAQVRVFLLEEGNTDKNQTMGNKYKLQISTKEQLDHLVHSGRFAGLGIYRVKLIREYQKGDCALCGNPLGHWYREYSFQSPEDIKAAHIMCAEYLTDEKGVLV